MNIHFHGLVALLAVQATLAGVVTHPAPAEEILSSDYTVLADGQTVPVYTARTLDAPFAGKQWDFGGPYAFANFVTDGPVEVRIRSGRSLANTVIRPARPDVTMRVEPDGALVVWLPGPRKLSVEPDGKKGPLLLFANPPEQDPPQPGGAGVIYFGPGVHRPGRIDVASNQTLCLAGGAVVKGGVYAQGENIRITGQGILDGSDYEWRKGPTPHVISIRGTNVEVSGITIRGASHWTIVPRDSRQVTIRGVKLCGSRVQNDDGINPCNSQDVLITDCFIRTDDDCVALKGLELAAPNSNVERVTVENCVLWCDRARIFLLGHESRAASMRAITLRNLDIIHFTMTPFLFEPGEEMRLEDVTVENVRLHGEGQGELARLKPVVNQYMRNKVPGHVQNILFRNVTLTGQAGAYRVQLSGADADHAVRNVRFENVEILGERLAAGSDRLEVGEHVEGIGFSPMFEDVQAAPKPVAQYGYRGMAGNIVELRDGALLLCYTDGGIATRLSRDGGRTWGGQKTLVPNPVAPSRRGYYCHPSLLRLKNGEMLLSYIYSVYPPVNKLPYYGHNYYRRSADDGETWSEQFCMTPTTQYMICHNDKVRQLSTGRIIAMAEYWKYIGANDHAGYVATAYYSDDDGYTWLRSENDVDLHPVEAQEPHVVELVDGRLMMVCRTYSGYPVRAFSADGGKTWSAGEQIPGVKTSRNSGAVTVERIPKTGDLVLLSQTGEGRAGRYRTPFAAFLSRDDGKTWTFARNLAEDPDDDYGYQSLIFVGDTALVSYHTRDGIHVVRMSADWFYDK